MSDDQQPKGTMNETPTPRKAKRFRLHSWDPDTATTVWLALEHDASYSTTWAVYKTEEGGERVGYLHRYTGTIDRQVGRLRSPGKRRTLWSSSDDPTGGNFWQKEVSAADALRDLLRG